MSYTHFSSMIPNISVVNNQVHKVFSPYDQTCLASVEMANAEVIEQALQNAYQLFNHREQWLDVVQRIEILESVMLLMRENSEELAVQASHEGGKPLGDSRIEMKRCIDSIRICVETLRTHSEAPPVMGINATCQQRAVIMQKEPIGIVLAVSAFNHPLNLIAHQIAPAIAVGCPVIIKPAGDTPLSCIRLVQLFHHAGLAKAWCQWLLPESRALAETLVRDARVSFFSFIGSAKVGWHLRRQLSDGTRCALEHGGVAPVIVHADADLQQALPALCKGAFYHAGQVCVSVQRIFVHESIARVWSEQLADMAQQLVVGNPLQELTEVGPLIRASEVERVDTWVKEAVSHGAELLCGGRKLAHQCYAPTVLYAPSDDVKVSQQEVFGPVVCIYPFVHLNDALAQANALNVSFQASVYSQNIDTALDLANRLHASTVMINDHTAFRVDWMPFSGLQESGLGVGGIPHTMHDMQVDKMMILHTRKSL